MSNENCPDVFEMADGNFAVIGREATGPLRGHLPSDAKLGPNERIVVVDRQVLLQAAMDMPRD
ncbi:hypothetical protein BIV57_19770 [Mangrovactinospora gilvigrisea]|uniref:Uncharacterized protein n=2 Tax=Mangrovactinospora gilvigrisea TaxID=1428644 RepID=A0A1J7C2J1_9ACTN|nr:hypothetical protein BIV57_19770 [Mangrovactinospora gilvigrisea]